MRKCDAVFKTLRKFIKHFIWPPYRKSWQTPRRRKTASTHLGS